MKSTKSTLTKRTLQRTATLLAIVATTALSACGGGGTSARTSVSGEEMLTWIQASKTTPCAELSEQADLMHKINESQDRNVNRNTPIKSLGLRTGIVLNRENLVRCSPDVDPATKQRLIQLYDSL